MTKNYPGDESSGLERPGAFRVNMAAGKEAFIAHTGRARRVTNPQVDADAPGPDALDAGIAHPVYGSLGWLAVTTPDRPPPLKYDGCLEQGPEVRRLLEQAHHLARARYLRRN